MAIKSFLQICKKEKNIYVEKSVGIDKWYGTIILNKVTVTPSSTIQPTQITLSILFYPHNYTSLLEYHQELLRNTRSYVVYQNVVHSL